MKLRRKAQSMLLTAFMLLLISCHTETPTGIDNTLPEVKLLLVYNSTDTLLYNHPDTTATYSNFSETIVEGDHHFLVEVSDNQDIYELVLCAEDTVTGDKYRITAVREPENGIVDIVASYKKFPVVQNGIIQDFNITLTVSDISENSYESSKYGFKVMKSLPFDLFHDKFGKIKEASFNTGTASDSIDFRGKNNKLAFIQFMSKG